MDSEWEDNMREIKFRAWDDNFKRWIDLNGSLGNSFWRDGELCGVQGYILFEQYTGLHDKNEVEIYEGDILTIFEYLNGTIWEGHVHNAEVIFEEGAFTIKPCWRHQSICQESEIIGNIHESPELLTHAP